MVEVQHQKALSGQFRKLNFTALVSGRLSASKGHAVIFTSFKLKTKPRHKKNHLDLKKNNQNYLLTKQPPVFGLELVSPALFAPRLCLWRLSGQSREISLPAQAGVGLGSCLGALLCAPVGPGPAQCWPRKAGGRGCLSLHDTGLSSPRGCGTWCQVPKLIGKYPHSTFVFHGTLALAKETSWRRPGVRREVSFSLYVWAGLSLPKQTLWSLSSIGLLSHQMV